MSIPLQVMLLSCSVIRYVAATVFVAVESPWGQGWVPPRLSQIQLGCHPTASIDMPLVFQISCLCYTDYEASYSIRFPQSCVSSADIPNAAVQLTVIFWMVLKSVATKSCFFETSFFLIYIINFKRTPHS